MTTYFRESFHTPLDRVAAEALVEQIDGLVEAELPDDIDEAQREDDDLGVTDVYHDLSIEAEKTPPPTALQARDRAAAQEDKGFDPSGFVFEAAALARLPLCRSTITLEYPSHVGETRFFAAVVKGLLDAMGPSVVETGAGTSWQTSETYATGQAKSRGEHWTKTRALGIKKKEKPPKPVKIRPPKGGELEAVGVQKRLARLIEDPIARSSLKEELEDATDAVRTYAAGLMEEGPLADAAMAKALGQKVEDVSTARLALAEILRRVAED